MEELENSERLFFDYPVSNGEFLRTYDFILPKFHFILPNPSFVAKCPEIHFCRETWVYREVWTGHPFISLSVISQLDFNL